MVVPSAETDFVNDFRLWTYHLHFCSYILWFSTQILLESKIIVDFAVFYKHPEKNKAIKLHVIFIFIIFCGAGLA